MVSAANCSWRAAAEKFTNSFTRRMLLLLWLQLYTGIVAAIVYKPFTPLHIRELQDDTRALFKHAWLSYMTYGFPADEVRPLSCEPYGPDYDNPFNLVRNDAMGNISLTIIDNLDTLVIMEEWDEFESVLDYLKTNKDTFFQKNTIVQVFETTIRSLGGLLSAHLLLSDIPVTQPRYARLTQISHNYDGFLLEMAHDLGKRLIPAFRTKSSIPLPRVHLSDGLKSIPASLQIDACTSGAGSPVLEFTLLSRLTGDPQFEYFSQVSFWKIWASRLPLDLVPMTLDPHNGRWKDSVSGIGASVDSFYEYALKSSIIFNDKHMWEVFKTSYRALCTHLAQGGGPLDATMLFANVGSNDGQFYSDWIDLLSAFWPGVQVLAGQLKDAVKTHMLFLKIWDYFDLIPERWNFRLADKTTNPIALEWYPLRPEFIESTYYLYRATRDPMYLQIGSRVLELLKTRFMAPCGLHGVQDIRTGEMQNRMETFVMSETLKYLYLLFDDKDELFPHNGMLSLKGWVFSTEAHPLWFNDKMDVLAGRSDLNASKLTEQDDVKLKEVLQKSLVQKGQKRMLGFVKNLNIRFYRQSMQKHMYPDVDVPYVYKVDPFEEKFNTCQIAPMEESFLSTRYYSTDALFEPDWFFRDSLVRPSYLSSSVFDGSYIELDPGFSSIFSVSNINRVCRRPPTTSMYDVILGDITELRNTEVSIFKYSPSATMDESVVLKNDLWVPDLAALRIRVEVLEVGKIDTLNSVLTQDYMESLAVDGEGNRLHNVTSAYRITKVNGVYVEPGLMVWTYPVNDNSGAISMNDLGRILIDNKVVENMMALWSE